jgi:carbon starvation protein
MWHALFADFLSETRDTPDGPRTLLHAMPLLLGALCVIMIAYRYYSAFLAAKVMALDDSRETPAHRLNDGQNYHPTNKWVLFGHHFAAISGAGPLIGPVLAIQYGYMPGLLWLVIGVCLAGAVQDMLVLAASVRRGGKSLAEIARTELGPFANVVVSAAILFIVVIALAGLGFVVVKALGGEEVKLPNEGMVIRLPKGGTFTLDKERSKPGVDVYKFPPGCTILYHPDSPVVTRPEAFDLRTPERAKDEASQLVDALWPFFEVPPGSYFLVKGSSWGLFTIACTIPIALLTGLYMYRIRKGAVLEASLIGASLTIAAVIAGNWIPGSPWEGTFSLGKGQTTIALCAYGFVASVLPVWMLLCPRDYLSSFLKIGTIAILIVGVFVANPVMEARPTEPIFANGGPTFAGGLFPFVFICIMCGAVSGFHALVSSGTTPKMIDRESHVRPIGYGAMLMEGVVGIVALIAAASLDPKIYYDINVGLDKAAAFQPKLDKLYVELGNVEGPSHLPVSRGRSLDQVEEMVGGESLRGRTGGAVTLAVGMSDILTKATSWVHEPEAIKGLMKYWYHFAIMFEALFILTTIDTGTRIARFLLQEAFGQVHPKFGQTDWLPGAVISTGIVTAGWGVLVYTGTIDVIWPMFGIANQLLAVVALTLVTTLLINTGRARYAVVTILPMLFVTATTMTAAVEMVTKCFPNMIAQGNRLSGFLSMAMTIFVIACVGALMLLAVARCMAVLRGVIPIRREDGGLTFDHKMGGLATIGEAGLLPSGRSEAIKSDAGAVTDRPS